VIVLSNGDNENPSMSSTPEVGEDHARQDGSDLLDDPERDVVADAPGDTTVNKINEQHYRQLEDVPDLAGEQQSQLDAPANSQDAPHEKGTEDPNAELLGDSPSADETTSIPDDSPSIQVQFSFRCCYFC
jgi:hypothetical protein